MYLVVPNEPRPRAARAHCGERRAATRHRVYNKKNKCTHVGTSPFGKVYPYQIANVHLTHGCREDAPGAEARMRKRKNAPFAHLLAKHSLTPQCAHEFPGRARAEVRVAALAKRGGGHEELPAAHAAPWLEQPPQRDRCLHAHFELFVLEMLRRLQREVAVERETRVVGEVPPALHAERLETCGVGVHVREEDALCDPRAVAVAHMEQLLEERHQARLVHRALTCRQQHLSQLVLADRLLAAGRRGELVEPEHEHLARREPPPVEHKQRAKQLANVHFQRAVAALERLKYAIQARRDLSEPRRLRIDAQRILERDLELRERHVGTRERAPALADKVAKPRWRCWWRLGT